MNAGAGKSSYILSKVPSFLDIFRGSIRVQIKDKILSPGPFYGIRDKVEKRCEHWDFDEPENEAHFRFYCPVCHC